MGLQINEARPNILFVGPLRFGGELKRGLIYLIISNDRLN